MANTLTFTGKVGAGKSITSTVLNNVTLCNFNFLAQTVRIVSDAGDQTFSLYEIATITYTVSSHSATIALS